MKELGMGPINAIDNIHIIEGRPSLSVHAIAGMLRAAGIKWELTKDNEPIYNQDKSKIMDYITTITFYEYDKQMQRTIINPISFKKSEAFKQNLLDKSNWKKMEIIMMRARALSIGGRFLGVTAGMLEVSEAADIAGITIDIDENGNPIKR